MGQKRHFWRIFKDFPRLNKWALFFIVVVFCVFFRGQMSKKKNGKWRGKWKFQGVIDETNLGNNCGAGTKFFVDKKMLQKTKSLFLRMKSGVFFSKKRNFLRKICETIVKTLFSVYEWYLLFCVIQRREITKNEEKRVFVWVVWSIILKIVSYNPKQNVVITCRFQNKKCWKKTTNLFLRMKSDVFFWKNTVFVTNLRDIIPKKDVKN